MCTTCPNFIGPCSTTVLYDIAFTICRSIGWCSSVGAANAANGEEEIGDTTGNAVAGTDGDIVGCMSGGKGNTIEEYLIGSDTAGDIEDVTCEGWTDQCWRCNWR